MISRRHLLAAGGLLGLGALGLSEPRAQPRPEPGPVRISVSDKASLYHLPLTVAERLGYFAAAGQQVQVNDYGTGAAALQALMDGRSDICAGAFKHTLSLQSMGRHVRAFVLEGRAPQIVTAISLRTLPRYRGIADLRGKRIGVSALGATTHLAATLLLARADLKPQDVVFVPVGFGLGAQQALESGEIDAISTVDPLITLLEQKALVRVISDTRTLKDTEALFGGPVPAGCLYAQESFIRARPHTVQAVTDAMVRALKWLQTAGPADIAKTVPAAYMLGDRALYLAAFQKIREAISPDGLVPEDAPATVLRSVAGFEPAVAGAKLDLGRVYTNDFVRRAQDRLG